MQLNIDFSPACAHVSLRAALLIFGSVIALTGTAWNCVTEFQNMQTAASQHNATRLKGGQKRLALPSNQVEAINRAIRQLNLPWEQLFTEIESKLTENVSLLSLEPDASTHLLHLQGEAKSPEDMLDFIHSLDDSDFFHASNLTRHEINEGDRNKPIRFFAETQWKIE